VQCSSHVRLRSIAQPRRAREVQRKYLAGEPYRKCHDVDQDNSRECLREAKFTRGLVRQIVAIVLVEGPIHEEIVAERLKEVNSVERLGSKVEANIRAGVKLALSNGAIERRDEYLERKGHRLRTYRVPGDGVERPGFVRTSPSERQQHNPRLLAHYDRLLQLADRPLSKIQALGVCMDKLLLFAFVMSQRRALSGEPRVAGAASYAAVVRGLPAAAPC